MAGRVINYYAGELHCSSDNNSIVCQLGPGLE